MPEKENKKYKPQLKRAKMTKKENKKKENKKVKNKIKNDFLEFLNFFRYILRLF